MDKPFELEFLETIDKRYRLSEDSKTELWRLQTGYEGEADFEAVLRDLVPADWVVLSDTNFASKIGRIQIDSLLISPYAIYHFEVKNLKTECEYREGEFRKTGTNKVYKNYFDQMKRQHDILKQILVEQKIYVPLVSKLVFINDEDTVTIYDKVHDKYLKRWQIKSFIRNEMQNQLEEAKKYAYQYNSESRIDPLVVKNILNDIKVPEHFKDSYPELEIVKDVRKGIICKQCATSIKEVGRYYVRCTYCGMTESKKRALVRTICEIGLMNYDKNLTYRMVSEFVDDDRLNRAIRRQLKTYFEKGDKTRKNYYKNPVASIDKAFEGEL